VHLTSQEYPTGSPFQGLLDIVDAAMKAIPSGLDAGIQILDCKPGIDESDKEL